MNCSPAIFNVKKRCASLQICSPLVIDHRSSSVNRIDYSGKEEFPFKTSPLKSENMEFFPQIYLDILTNLRNKILMEKEKKMESLHSKRRKRISMEVSCLLDNLEEFTSTPVRLKLMGNDEFSFCPESSTPKPKRRTLKKNVSKQDEYIAVLNEFTNNKWSNINYFNLLDAYQEPSNDKKSMKLYEMSSEDNLLLKSVADDKDIEKTSNIEACTVDNYIIKNSISSMVRQVQNLFQTQSHDYDPSILQVGPGISKIRMSHSSNNATGIKSPYRIGVLGKNPTENIGYSCSGTGTPKKTSNTLSSTPKSHSFKSPSRIASYRDGRNKENLSANKLF